jgi:hypothetical protein
MPPFSAARPRAGLYRVMSIALDSDGQIFQDRNSEHLGQTPMPSHESSEVEICMFYRKTYQTLLFSWSKT